LAYGPRRYLQTKKQLDFQDYRACYSSKSTKDIIRALAVFRLCTVQSLVKRCKEILDGTRRVLGDRITFFLVRNSFFSLFCGGETQEDLNDVVGRLSESGIGSIFDYAAEADVEEEDEREMTGRAIDELIEEPECDANVSIFLECINGAYNATSGLQVGKAKPPFAAIKVTALGRPILLEKMTEIIRKTHSLFNKFDGKARMRLSRTDFARGLQLLGVSMPQADMDSLFDEFDTDKKGYISTRKWLEYLRIEDLRYRPLFKAKHPPDANDEFLLPTLDDREEKMLENLNNRLLTIVEEANSKGVKLMVDAEQYYFQPAIDHVVMNLMRKYNQGKCVVFTTHQAYTRDCETRLKQSIAVAQRENFELGVKLVRGAYMQQERQRAAALGYPDPIWSTINETHLSYQKCLETIMDNIDIMNVMIGSHNLETMEFAVNAIDTGRVPRDRVFFGQLLGMSDNLTFTLGLAGHNVYKYVPYGPLVEVIPYLTRRAQENSTLLGNTATERKLLWKELRRRCFWSSKE